MTSRQHSPLITFALIISLYYLSYLAMTTQAIIFNDALSYEHWGRIFAQGNWQDYFISGPNREPLYSFLVSVAMRLSDILHVPYLSVQIPIQILWLVSAQCLMIKVLK